MEWSLVNSASGCHWPHRRTHNFELVRQLLRNRNEAGHAGTACNLLVVVFLKQTTNGNLVYSKFVLCATQVTNATVYLNSWLVLRKAWICLSTIGCGIVYFQRYVYLYAWSFLHSKHAQREDGWKSFKSKVFGNSTCLARSTSHNRFYQSLSTWLSFCFFFHLMTESQALAKWRWTASCGSEPQINIPLTIVHF